MIEVKDINKSFGKDQILYDVNSVFEKGKVNLIIGQSGQGKSVLAKCIVGLHDVDSGQVLYDGRNFTSMNRNEKSQLNTLFLVQLSMKVCRNFAKMLKTIQIH